MAIVANIFGGMLGGLAGGTAITTQTNAFTANQTWYQPTQLLGTMMNNLGWQQASPWTTGATPWTTNQFNVYGVGTNTINLQQTFFQYQTLQTNTPTVWTPQLTPEQLAKFEVAEEEARVARAAAKTRAMDLLTMALDGEQREQFLRDGHFDVKIADRCYRITPGRKVLALHDKSGTPALCIHPLANLPMEDVALAQKLHLETNEKEFLRRANRWAA